MSALSYAASSTAVNGTHVNAPPATGGTALANGNYTQTISPVPYAPPELAARITGQERLCAWTGCGAG